MNHIMIAGHLGTDPEARFTSSGKKVTTLRVATNMRRGNTDETIWWRVSVWGDQFDKMISYLKKGSPVVVAGELQKPELFTDREGKQQISMGITAYQLQFSPFGKPDRPASQEGATASHQEPAQSFGGAASSYQPSGAASSYSSYGAPKPSAAAPAQPPMQAPMQAAGTTFDDEIPF